MKVDLTTLAAIALLIASVPASATEPVDGWTRLKAGNAFSFEAPQGTEAVPVRGIDSFVGRYRSGNFDLDFDFGPYSNSLDGYRNDARFTYKQELIDGKQAVIVTGPGSGDPGCGFFTGVHMLARMEASTRISLSMVACTTGSLGVEELHHLFRSIKLIARP